MLCSIFFDPRLHILSKSTDSLFKIKLRKMTITSLNQIFLLITIFLLVAAKGLKLDETGAYQDVVIAINENTAQNEIEDYLDNIKIGVQELSTSLKKATGNKFRVGSVKILVPHTWRNPPFNDKEQNSLVASWENYAEADIQISYQHRLPYVTHVYPCGKSGKAIKLPYNFFNEPRQGGNYGPVGKTLLNLWSRYRFGVWEEHGYPDDIRSPYFFRKADQWRITGCSDIALDGNFINLNGEDEACNQSDEINPPPSSCRFFPKDEQMAVSSIMDFHWIANIEQFCNTATHNKEAPNRHNKFCMNKSVYDVIKNSEDFQKVTLTIKIESTVASDDIKFEFLKNSNHPRFYIMIDSGKTMIPPKDIEKLRDKLFEFIEELKVTRDSLNGTSAAIGSFPMNDKPYGDVLDWTIITDSSINKFSKSLEKALRSDSFISVRNFGAAIKHVANKARQQRHGGADKGTILLLIKTGQELDSGNILNEPEVLSAVLDNRILVYAVEYRSSPSEVASNLLNIVEACGGVHLNISNSEELEKISIVLDSIKDKLSNGIGPNKFRQTRMYSGSANFSHSLEILTNVYGSTGANHFYIDAREFAPKNMVWATGHIDGQIGAYPIADRQFERYNQWNMNDLFVATFLHFRKNDVRFEEQTVWYQPTFECGKVNINQCGPIDYYVIGELGRNTDFTDNDGIHVNVYTNFESKFIDFSSQSYSELGMPLLIFCEITYKGIPVSFNETFDTKIKANIHLLDEMTLEKVQSWTLDLVDDGKGIPDFSMNDGVYSGVFNPIEDGPYRISVSVNSHYFIYRKRDTTEHSSSVLAHNIKLIPENYTYPLGCKTDNSNCPLFIPSFDVSKVEEMDNLIITNSIEIQNKPMRILDLMVEPENKFKLKFEWTEPWTVSKQGAKKVSCFEMHRCKDVEEIWSSIELCESIQGLPLPTTPGTRHSFEFTDTESSEYYYAILSISDEIKSVPSNLVRGKSVQMFIPPTTTDGPITTSTSTTTTTTTTPPPATSTSTTEPPERTSTQDPSGPATTPNWTTKPYSPTPPTMTTMLPTTSTEQTRYRRKTTEASVHWYASTVGIASLSAVGAVIACLLIGVVIFVRVVR